MPIRTVSALVGILVLTLAACVTINVYFPEAAAERLPQSDRAPEACRRRKEMGHDVHGQAEGKDGVSRPVRNPAFRQIRRHANHQQLRDHVAGEGRDPRR